MLCFALLSFALLCFAMLCFALRCFALLSFAKKRQQKTFKKNFVMFLTLWIFLTFFDFSFWGGEPGSGGPGNPGGPVPSGNPGRGQAGTAHPLLWNTVRTPKAKPNWGNISL